jgi:hypothetical protein
MPKVTSASEKADAAAAKAAKATITAAATEVANTDPAVLAVANATAEGGDGGGSSASVSIADDDAAASAGAGGAASAAPPTPADNGGTLPSVDQIITVNEAQPAAAAGGAAAAPSPGIAALPAAPAVAPAELGIPEGTPRESWLRSWLTWAFSGNIKNGIEILLNKLRDARGTIVPTADPRIDSQFAKIVNSDTTLREIYGPIVEETAIWGDKWRSLRLATYIAIKAYIASHRSAAASAAGGDELARPELTKILHLILALLAATIERARAKKKLGVVKVLVASSKGLVSAKIVKAAAAASTNSQGGVGYEEEGSIASRTRQRLAIAVVALGNAANFLHAGTVPELVLTHTEISNMVAIVQLAGPAGVDLKSVAVNGVYPGVRGISVCLFLIKEGEADGTDYDSLGAEDQDTVLAACQPAIELSLGKYYDDVFTTLARHPGGGVRLNAGRIQTLMGSVGKASPLVARALGSYGPGISGGAGGGGGGSGASRFGGFGGGGGAGSNFRGSSAAEAAAAASSAPSGFGGGGASLSVVVEASVSDEAVHGLGEFLKSKETGAPITVDFASVLTHIIAPDPVHRYKFIGNITQLVDNITGRNIPNNFKMSALRVLQQQVAPESAAAVAYKGFGGRRKTRGRKQKKTRRRKKARRSTHVKRNRKSRSNRS